MALAGWQLACHQLHILVPMFTSRALHIPLGQECVPKPLREVPEYGIDVHKQMKQAPVEISRHCRLVSAPTANMAPSVQ